MEGYSRYKDGMFQIRRNDADILIIPNKYIDELRALPNEKVSAIEAHIKVEMVEPLTVPPYPQEHMSKLIDEQNLLGPYSTTR